MIYVLDVFLLPAVHFLAAARKARIAGQSPTSNSGPVGRAFRTPHPPVNLKIMAVGR